MAPWLENPVEPKEAYSATWSDQGPTLRELAAFESTLPGGAAVRERIKVIESLAARLLRIGGNGFLGISCSMQSESSSRLASTYRSDVGT